MSAKATGFGPARDSPNKFDVFVHDGKLWVTHKESLKSKILGVIWIPQSRQIAIITEDHADWRIDTEELERDHDLSTFEKIGIVRILGATAIHGRLVTLHRF